MTTLFRTTLAAASFLALATPALAAEVTLKGMNFLPPQHEFSKPFLAWVEEVNKDGKGLIQIDMKAVGSMPPTTMGNAVKTGVVDLVHLPSTFYSNILPAMNVTTAIEKSPEELRKNGAMALFNKVHEEKMGVHYLGHWGLKVPFTFFLTFEPPTPFSLEGRKIRTSPVARALLNQLKAVPVQTTPGEIFVALERGTVEGVAWPLWDIESGGWGKFIKYRVEPPFYNTQEPVLINLAKWKSLSDEQRKFLTDKMMAFEEEMWAEEVKINDANRKRQAEIGVKVYQMKPEEAKAFHKMALDAVWAETEKLDPELTAQLKPLLRN